MGRKGRMSRDLIFIFILLLFFYFFGRRKSVVSMKLMKPTESYLANKKQKTKNKNKQKQNFHKK